MKISDFEKIAELHEKYKKLEKLHRWSLNAFRTEAQMVITQPRETTFLVISHEESDAVISRYREELEKEAEVLGVVLDDTY